MEEEGMVRSRAERKVMEREIEVAIGITGITRYGLFPFPFFSFSNVKKKSQEISPTERMGSQS